MSHGNDEPTTLLARQQSLKRALLVLHRLASLQHPAFWHDRFVDAQNVITLVFTTRLLVLTAERRSEC